MKQTSFRTNNFIFTGMTAVPKVKNGSYSLLVTHERTYIYLEKISLMAETDKNINLTAWPI